MIKMELWGLVVAVFAVAMAALTAVTDGAATSDFNQDSSVQEQRGPQFYNDDEHMVGDTFELQKAKPICKSALGGRCLPSNVDCGKEELESPSYGTYCPNNTRCCYPGPKWSREIKACIALNNKRIVYDVTFEECKAECARETNFVCRSVDYWPGGDNSNGQHYPVQCDLQTADNTHKDYRQPCYSPFSELNIYAQIEYNGLPHPITSPPSNPPTTTTSVAPSCQDLQKAVAHLCVSTQCPTTQSPTTCPPPTTCPTTDPPMTTPTRGCPDRFEECPYGNCYYFSSSYSSYGNWEEARHKCQNMGSNVHLAELGNPKSLASDEWLLLRIKDKGHNSIWLGASRNTNWIWSHSRRNLPITFPFWAQDEPNNHGGNEKCVSAAWFGTHRRHYLNDAPCNTENYFVCQIFK